MSGKKHNEVHYEFFGPIGVSFIIPGLHLVTYLLYLTCNEDGCLTLSPLDAPLLRNKIPPWSKFFSWEACAVWLGWFSFQALLHILLPGKWLDGVPLADGSRLKYKINALQAYIVSLVLFVGGALSGVFPGGYLFDNFLPLLTASSIFSVILALYLYLRSLTLSTGFAAGGNTGNAIYDFYIGRELNPRIGWFDLKYFCEMRPGLILWVLMDLSFAFKQYELHGFVTNSMILVCAFHFMYIFDAELAEPAILTTMDITTDGFGWMLVFGDLTWVPFVYSLQARYLVSFPHQLSYLGVIGVLALHFIGLFIFRSSNSQKDEFRKDPNSPAVKHLKYLPTERGSKLLISGWWGTARHINYFGDILMGLSYCMTTGFNHVIPYFYAIYFVTLLVHRELRDEEKCHKKYGKDWEKYCSIVKWRIVPYIY